MVAPRRAHMKIGIVSDTHRNLDYLKKVAEWMVEKQHISTLCHLGDNYEDIAALEELYVDVVQVPGIYHPKYQDGSLSPKVVESVEGVRIMLVHALEKDFSNEDKFSA